VEYCLYIGSAIVGLFYFVMGARLHRLSVRTGKRPERLLSRCFALWGLSYLSYNLVYLLGVESLHTPIFFTSRVVMHAGTVIFALFTWNLFRSRERWAGWLVAGVGVLLLVGVAGAAATGDWEGVLPLSEPWFWMEWVGAATASAWMGTEGLVRYRSARQRVRLGSCDPLVCNRYLCWGVAGALWMTSEFVVIPQYIDYQITQSWSNGIDAVMLVLDTIAIGMMWVVFFPPAVYRQWINRAASSATVEGS
jgi:hypothetical protein